MNNHIMSAYMAQETDPAFVKICCSGRYAW